MGKMKTMLLIAAFTSLAASSQVKAQSSFYLGIKGGLDIPKLQAGGNSPVSKGYSSILGPYFGVFADYSINKSWSIQPELNFSVQGGQKSGMQAIPGNQFDPQIPAGTYFYANFKSKAKLNYLELPILAKYKISLGKEWKFIVDLGPYVGYLMNAKNITSGTSPVYMDSQETQPVVPSHDFDSTSSITTDIHRFNWGVQGGVGLQYYTRHTGYFYLNVGGNYGFMNIQKYAEDGKNNTGAATVALGYALRLK
jgi:hypothetical protein